MSATNTAAARKPLTSRQVEKIVGARSKDDPCFGELATFGCCSARFYQIGGRYFVNVGWVSGNRQRWRYAEITEAAFDAADAIGGDVTSIEYAKAIIPIGFRAAGLKNPFAVPDEFPFDDWH